MRKFIWYESPEGAWLFRRVGVQENKIPFNTLILSLKELEDKQIPFTEAMEKGFLNEDYLRYSLNDYQERREELKRRFRGLCTGDKKRYLSKCYGLYVIRKYAENENLDAMYILAIYNVDLYYDVYIGLLTYAAQKGHMKSAEILEKYFQDTNKYPAVDCTPEKVREYIWRDSVFDIVLTYYDKQYGMTPDKEKNPERKEIIQNLEVRLDKIRSVYMKESYEKLYGEIEIQFAKLKELDK